MSSFGPIPGRIGAPPFGSVTPCHLCVESVSMRVNHMMNHRHDSLKQHTIVVSCLLWVGSLSAAWLVLCSGLARWQFRGLSGLSGE
jgi:hypothetical protein